MKKLLPVIFFAVPAISFACPDGQHQEGICPVCGCFPNASVPPVINDTINVVKNAAGGVVSTATSAAGLLVQQTVQTGGNAVTAVVKAGNDASATYVKAWKDSSEQAQRSTKDIVDAGTAVTNFSINQLKAQTDALSNVKNRIRDGKVIDAMWGYSVEPLQASEANFAKATQESTLVATAASSAAAAYGGPGGAAAYAAWATYRATGNADQAFRAGLLAAVTNQAGGGVSTMPTGTMGEVIKKAAMAGAAGGIAVAAAGGDEAAVTNAFLKSSGAVLVQAANDDSQAFSPQVKDAYKTVQCISARDVSCLSKTTWVKDATGRILKDANGKPIVDPKSLDPNQYIGKWTQIDPNSDAAKLNKFVTQVSQLPNSNVIPLMKNRYVLTWTTGPSTDIQYGQPIAVLTYVGPQPPFTSKVRYGDDVEPAVPSSNGQLPIHYECTLAGIDRIVTVKKMGAGCESMYSREDGNREVVWHSDHNPNICAQKAAEFIPKLNAKGIKCVAK